MALMTTKNLLSDWLLTQFQNLNNSFIENALRICIGLALIALVIYLSDWILKKIFSPIITKIVNQTKFTWDEVFVEKKVFNSVIHLISVGVGALISPYLLGETALLLLNKLFGISLVLVFGQFVFRMINSFLVISTDENNYSTIAVRTFGQTIKIISFIFGLLLIASILFDLEVGAIVTGLSATTAIFLLIFKDTILGFVSGIQIATSKSVKVGDWIEIDKYRVSGIVKEINLVSAKIENFDKTISTLPTYDLISTKVKNYEPLKGLDIRRIKQSIYFDITSFHFLEESELKNYQKIDTLKDYFSSKEIQSSFPATTEHSLNKAQLTNIGTFRAYALNYLKSLSTIDQNQTLLVRQREISPKGMPLEIYCFTTTADWLAHEQIKSDIFDHLMTSAKYFDLKILQSIRL